LLSDKDEDLSRKERMSLYLSAICSDSSLDVERGEGWAFDSRLCVPFNDLRSASQRSVGLST
jgi:hypothetical protein